MYVNIFHICTPSFPFTAKRYLLHTLMEPGLHFVPSIQVVELRFTLSRFAPDRFVPDRFTLDKFSPPVRSAKDKLQLIHCFVDLNCLSWVASKLYPKPVARKMKIKIILRTKSVRLFNIVGSSSNWFFLSLFYLLSATLKLSSQNLLFFIT